MEHEPENGQNPAPGTPQSLWQSLNQEEEFGMEMSLTTDQLCTRARFREKENIWFQWIAVVACGGLGAMFAWRAVTAPQLSFRVASAWLALLMALAVWGSIRVGARRILDGESCAQFMVRELEGSRRTLLALRWGIALLLPPLSTFWWGAWRTMQASGLAVADPLAWRHARLTFLRSIAVALVAFLAGWISMGREARKRARQAKELRRAIGMPE